MNILFFVAVFILSSMLHFGVQKLFINYKRFDDINHRSSHNTLATRTGGIGLFFSLLIVSLYYYFQGIELFDYSLFVPLSIMFVVGVYDDFYNADFKLKFLLQIIVAKILIDQGYVISNYYGLFGLYEVSWLLAQASTVFVFLVVVNAINFIDGIDGLAISQVFKILVIIEVFSVEFTPLYSMGLTLVLAILPLYYFNFKRKRKVFLGDSGSLLLGTVVSIYAFYLLSENYTINQSLSINKTLLSVIVLVYPLIDLIRVFVIRLKNKKSPFEPDQNHLHHFFLKKTKSQFYSVLIILLIDFFILSLTFLFIKL
jgi:UDP-GlcNAc:undecaprenyl-phosphate/decaprenyl-phosphate GlcNAc-1-phosphate transferase